MTTDEPAPGGDDLDALRRARRCHWVTHLERHAHEQPDRVALRFLGASTTWRELAAQVSALAGALARRGVARGDRVAVLMTNRPELVVTVLAANRLGALAVPLNTRLAPGEVAYVLDDCGARALVTDGGLAGLAADAAGRVAGAAPRLVVAGSEAGAGGLREEALEALLAEGGDPAPAVDVAETDPALVMYTSGTTGRPKGAVLTHLNLHLQALTIVRAWALTGGEDVNLVAVPLFHIGAIGSVAPFLFTGQTTVVHPSGAFDAAELLDVCERERVTCLFLVPTQWQAVCADPGLASRDLALRIACWGAAPASDVLLRRMAEALPGARTVAVFGQTETSPVTCVLDGEDALRRLGSVGRPISTLQVRVVDGDLRDVPRGEVGEIVYRGPTVMAGYWGDEAATREAFRGGWFHSGDLVRQDDEGFVYVVDRLKDMVISGGENVYCAEVENVLAGHPRVAEVAVVGRPDPRWGEVPVAVVATTDGGGLDVEEVAAWCEGRLARYKRPRDVVVVPALPRNASGKVVKGELRAAQVAPGPGMP